MFKNYGYSRYNDSGVQTSIISGEQGIFQLIPPASSGTLWKVRTLLTEAASDAVMFDIDNDGEDELAVIFALLRIQKGKSAMYVKQTQIINKTGLHARPSAVFVQKAKEFEAKVRIRNLDADDAIAVNAKSIVSILVEGFSCQTHVEITAEGSDEKKAVNALVELIEAGFDDL